MNPMIAEIVTERGLLVEDHQLSRDPYSKVSRQSLFPIHGFNANGTSVLYLPAVVYGFMTELIKVDLSTKQVQCKFSIYVALKINLERETIANLTQIQLATKTEAQKQVYITEQLEKLSRFVENNLIVQCGDKVIDIVNAEQTNNNKEYSDYNDEQTDSEEDSEEDEDCYWIKLPKNNSRKSVTYQIIGTFKCSFQLHNLYFPYHHIKSSLCVKVRQQYYNRMAVRYNLYNFQDDDNQVSINSQDCQMQNQYTIKQFSFKFREASLRKFGNYKISCCPSSYLSTAKTEVLQQILSYSNDSSHKQHHLANIQHQKVVKQTIFHFQIYSYNVPFILRYLVPLLVLCYASLMAYFADSSQISNTFSNVILIGITLIQQLSNFRTSKYDNTKLNFYQATIICIIIINFLLVKITTQHFYEQGSDEQANSQSIEFLVAVCIAGFCLILNSAIMIIFKYKVTHYYEWQAQKNKEQKTWNYFWVWNHELFGSVENEIEFGQVANVMTLRNSEVRRL